MEKHYIPRYLHAQPQLLWWELDEVIVLSVFVSIGFITGKTLIFAVIGFAMMKFYASLKYSKQDGYLKHFFYRLGLYNPPGKKIPEYWIKEVLK